MGIVRLLVVWGADVNQPNKYGKTPVWISVYYAQSDTIRVLKELGCKESDFTIS